MNDDNTETEAKNENKGNQKVTAKSLMAQGAAEARKSLGEAFKSWSKNRQAEINALQQSIDLIKADMDNAAADFDRGIWIAPKNQNQNNQQKQSS